MNILKNNDLPNWINPYTIPDGVTIFDNEKFEDDYLWRLLAKCCPNKYEKYIVILHPFWFNQKLKELNLKDIFPEKNEIKEEDYERWNYIKFLNYHNKQFDLKTAKKTANEIWNENKWGTKNKKWPKYLSYPAEGEIDSEELDLITFCIENIYGNIETDFYYHLLKNESWEDGEGKIIRGKVLDATKIDNFTNVVNGNPSAIYPSNTKDWCIVSDYDLDFTFMGGSKNLIDCILTKKKECFDIYELKQKFEVKKASG